jgi:hypothetical protein
MYTQTCFFARQLAVQALGKSGPAAVRTIREMLDDPASAEQAQDLIEAMVKAGGKGVGTDLIRRFSARSHIPGFRRTFAAIWLVE